jgi:N-acyl-D-aspartate/D-glutamate deacylase
MPSQRLERSTPNARKKGRMQEGADADIVVFDPQTITDRATFQHPTEQSTGVHYLIVNGTLLIDQGKLVTNQFPGQPLLGSEKH